MTSYKFNRTVVFRNIGGDRQKPTETTDKVPMQYGTILILYCDWQVATLKLNQISIVIY
jgi:hypothetical protein